MGLKNIRNTQLAEQSMGHMPSMAKQSSVVRCMAIGAFVDTQDLVRKLEVVVDTSQSYLLNLIITFKKTYDFYDIF